MKGHFVIFFSPGTFTAEKTEKPIDSWNITQAMEMAKEIMERHSAVPFGFCFSTRARGDGDLDSHEVARSPMYYLGGEVFTLEQLEARNLPEDKIIIENMKNCNANEVIINSNSWKWTSLMNKGDVVLITPKKE